MKNPLTPIRFAVSQLERGAREGEREALEVIRAESSRLEQLAREFTEFGRLPEGPAAEVDLQELLEGLLRDRRCRRSVRASSTWHAETPRVLGHYDPLRRAFGNLLRNAVEAAGTRAARSKSGRACGRRARCSSASSITAREFPTACASGCSSPMSPARAKAPASGLALVRQTIENHGGKVRVTETPGGGATFEVTLPVPA